MIIRDFSEFKLENSGNSYKYCTVKEENEKIHRNINRNNKVYTEKDMEKKSEDFIKDNVFDIGRGKFISLKKLSSELNKYKTESI